MWHNQGHGQQQGGHAQQQSSNAGVPGFHGMNNLSNAHTQLANAASNAQQNHYNRIAAASASHAHNLSGGTGSQGAGGIGQGNGNGAGPTQNGQSHGMGQGGDATSVVETQGLGNYTDENKKVLSWVAELLNNNGNKETALMELSKKREQVPELALIIWHSFGVMTSLLQEIISVYPLLNPSQLTAAASNRVCNALALLQCVASHAETRGLFLSAHIPLFLYPFSTRPRNRDRSSICVLLLSVSGGPL